MKEDNKELKSSVEGLRSTNRIIDENLTRYLTQLQKVNKKKLAVEDSLKQKEVIYTNHLNSLRKELAKTNKTLKELTVVDDKELIESDKLMGLFDSNSFIHSDSK